MSFWKGLRDKVAEKKEQLKEEAKRRATAKAAELAIETSKATARAAVRTAGKTLDYAGERLEALLFGDHRPTDAPPSAGPDPFAKVKADERARKDGERAAEKKRASK